MANYGIVADARDALSAASQGEREQDKRRKRSPEDILAEAKESYDLAYEAWQHNRDAALDDIKFARLGEQWPDEVLAQRKLDERPCLTVNKLPSFIRQVVNDSRQNKPSMVVHPVDSSGDTHTADIINGLIRNIEYTSNADVTYDTSIESAVTGGYGYFHIGLDYAYDDAFDLDIQIDRVSDPLAIFGDPFATAADSSDWNSAHAVEMMRKRDFEAEYPDAKPVDFAGEYGELDGSVWIDREKQSVMRAEYWTRSPIKKKILLLSDQQVVDAKIFEQHALAVSDGAYIFGDPNNPVQVLNE